MKFSFIVDKEREEEIIIYAHERNEIVNAIEKIVCSDDAKLFGITDRDELINLEAKNISCFFVENNKVYAMRGQEKLLVRQRLYQLEEKYDQDFVKINQSCLVNLNMIAKFSSSISGALSITLKNGYKDYISRRQLKTVKERIGFGK